MGMSIKFRIFFFLLLLGFLIRIAVMLWSFQFRENTDVLRYRDWARIAYLYGFKSTYDTKYLQFGTLPNNQPPGSVYILSSMYYVQLQVAKTYSKITHTSAGSIQWINGPLQNAFLRLPAILADLGIATLIYLFVKNKTNNFIFLAPLLFLFNPVSIYNSAFWGQMDSLNNMFFLLGLFLLYKKRFLLSVLFVFLSFYIKFSLIFLLPFFIYFVYRFSNLKTLIRSLGISFFIIFILTIPISINPLWLVSFAISNGTGEMTQITNFAFNFWWAFFKPAIMLGKPEDLFSFSQIRLENSPYDDTVFFGTSLLFLSILVFCAVAVPLFYKLIKIKTLNLETIFFVCSVVAFLGFLFLPRMHERYLYPFFPLFATYVGLKQKYVVPLVITSFLNLFNLYMVWHPMKIFFMPYSFISNSWIQWIISFGIVATGVFLYTQCVKALSYEKSNKN